MGGRMTATVNSNGDVCAVQKAGGEGVTPNMIMQCLRIASVKAADITSKIKNAVSCMKIQVAFDFYGCMVYNVAPYGFLFLFWL